MSVSSRTPGTPGTPAPEPSPPEPASIPLPVAAGRPDVAGLVFARVTATPALLALAFLLAGFPLLMFGAFRPVPVIALSLIVAAVIVPLGLRRIPGLMPDTDTVRADDRLWALPGVSAARGRATPWWPLVSLVVIAVAFFIFQAVYHSQFVIVTRDPASYMQIATWLSGHGSLPVPVNRAPFGGDSRLWFQSYATYQVGNTIVLQFMTGLPMVLSAGFWLGGVNAALLMAPLLGAAGILTFGGLAARLIGPRWAPLAALILAVSLPQQFTSRSTYSETLSQVLFIGGLALVIDSLRVSPRSPSSSRWDSSTVLAALAGLTLGINLLVRLDAPADVLPLIPYCGLLLVRRQRQAVPLLIGLVVGFAYGTYDGLVFSWPYVMQTNISSVKPMVELIAAVVVATAIGMLLLHRGRRKFGSLPRVRERWWLPRWLPAVSTVVPFVVLVVFGVRSHFQKDYVKEQYAQLSLHWVYWYAGGVVIALAAVGAAALLYGCMHGRWPGWSLPLVTFSWDIVWFLYRPGITPDQPWASRRLVPAVLPGFLLLAVWATAWVTGQIRQPAGVWAAVFRGALWGAAGRIRGLRHAVSAPVTRTLASAGVAFLCAVGFLAPTAVATFGLSVHGGGPAGVRVDANGLAFKRTYAGQVAAVYDMCARIPAGSSVLIIDGWTADRMTQVLHGMCGLPVAGFHPATPGGRLAAVPQVLAAIRAVERAGRRPVLLAGYASQLKPYKNGTVTRVMKLRSDMDGHVFLSKPLNVQGEPIDIWMWEPAR